MTDTTNTPTTHLTGVFAPFTHVTATEETPLAFVFSATRTSDGKAVTICIPKPDDREGA